MFVKVKYVSYFISMVGGQLSETQGYEINRTAFEYLVSDHLKSNFVCDEIFFASILE